MAERAISNHTLEIDGVETFRRVMVICSMIFGVITLLLLTLSGHKQCVDTTTKKVHKLTYGLWTCFGV